jgi:hypothetical protein
MGEPDIFSLQQLMDTDSSATDRGSIGLRLPDQGFLTFFVPMTDVFIIK